MERTDNAVARTGAAAFLFPTAARDRVIHILGLDHVVLRVKDLPGMTRFYRDVLGCVVERELKEPVLVQLRAGQSLIDLTPARADWAPDDGGRNMDHMCLRVEPFDQAALVAHLIRYGIVPGEARTRYGADGYGPSIYISDPEGNVIELKGPPSANLAA